MVCFGSAGGYGRKTAHTGWPSFLNRFFLFTPGISLKKLCALLMPFRVRGEKKKMEQGLLKSLKRDVLNVNTSCHLLGNKHYLRTAKLRKKQAL